MGQLARAEVALSRADKDYRPDVNPGPSNHPQLLDNY